MVALLEVRAGEGSVLAQLLEVLHGRIVLQRRTRRTVREHGGFVWGIRPWRPRDTDDRSRVTASNFRHNKGEMIKGTVVVAGERENFPVILPVIFKRGVAVRSVTL